MGFNGRFLLNLIHYATTRGLQLESLVALTTLSHDHLNEEDTRITTEVYDRVLQEIIVQTQDELFGLRAGEYLNLSAAGLVGQITQTSATVQEALQYCCEFANLGCSMLPMALTEEADNFKLTITPHPLWLQHSPDIVRHTVDGVIAFTIRQFSALTRQQHTPLCIDYGFQASQEVHFYEKAFQAPVYFNKPITAIFLDKKQVTAPIITSNYDLLRTLVSFANTKSKQMATEEGFHNAVRRTLIHMMPTALPSLAQVAASFNVSTRTFQRKLKEEGYTFQSLVDALRQEFAKSYLQDTTLQMADIAYLLGYAEASVFARAFKRWTNQTPQEYRFGVLNI
ncbi:MAG: AraC family transcriptional regulator ligand-binding domain-containing protein [Thermonemataceae bacterium]